MITPPRIKYSRNPRPHEVSVRRNATTRQMVATSRLRIRGFVVRVAAAANPMAHAHQAAGCRPRRD
jgi:hypothetical protein